MSSTVLNNTIITPGASIDGEYLNNGQPWANVQEYLEYKDNEFATIPVPKTIFVDGYGEMWNKGTQSERVFVKKEISVVDSLDSVDPNAALSAKQGKVLSDIIGDVNTVLESLLGNNA